MSSTSTPTRTELSGASAVTFLVLLLLLGGVDCRSAEAFGCASAWASGGVVHEAVSGATDREVRIERQDETAFQADALRVAARSVLPARMVATAMLPRPRAPDNDRTR